MYLSHNFRLYPNSNQQYYLIKLIDNFDIEVNRVISKFLQAEMVYDIRFKEINNTIPWDSKIEVIKVAKELYLQIVSNNFTRNEVKIDYCKWTNINCQFLNSDKILIQTFMKEETLLKTRINEYIWSQINDQKAKITSFKIFKRNNKWIGNITYDIPQAKNDNENMMAIDLGIKIPAVVATNTGKIRFFGNGRKKRYIHTKQARNYKEAQKNLDCNAVHKKKWSNKLKEIDHKISKQIIEFAVQEKVKYIKLENLSNLQKNNAKLNGVSSWSYRRLQNYIVYKAKRNGIIILWVNPKNTSKKCPNCFKINNNQKRKYICSCGYSNHRDIVGALNILNNHL